MLAKNQKGAALRFLDVIISRYDLGLFGHDTTFIREVAEARNQAWRIRIDLLREWGRLTEALAWVCLECEINPDDKSALVLKEQLKRDSNLDVRDQSQLATEGLLPKRKSDMEPDRWLGVAGMRDVKAMLERDVIMPLQEPELYKKYRLDLPNGILFYGPPGCGKTYIARKLAARLKFHFIEIKPSDIASIYVHGTQQLIQRVFGEAEAKQPSLVFLDEIDAMVPSRQGESVGHHYSSEVNEFLAHLNECWKKGVLVVGATNLVSRVDPAARRPGRLDKKVFIGPPDVEARVELFKLYMEGRPQEKLDWLGLAMEADLYTCAELQHVVAEAARRALDVRQSIKDVDIRIAMKNNRPAHTRDQIERMRDME